MHNYFLLLRHKTYLFKGCSKNYVELIIDFLEMNFCQLRRSIAGYVTDETYKRAR